MRNLFILLVVLVVVVGGFFAVQAVQAQRQANSASQYQTTPTSRGNLTATVGATGVVRANQTALLTWHTTGTVSEVLVALGDAVEADQILARLEKTSLAQNVILAEAERIQAQRNLEDLQESSMSRASALQALTTARQVVIDAERAMEVFDQQEYEDDLEAAREEIVDARETLRDAEDDFEPYADWAEDNQTRQNFEEQLEDAQRDYNEALRALTELELQQETAQANLNIAQAQLADAQREFDRLRNGPDPDEVRMLETRIEAAEATLETAVIKAPFDGTITTIDIAVGDQAAPTQNAIRMDDLSRLLVEVEITEVDVNRVQLGQSASLTFDAVPNKEYQGQVIEVARVGAAMQGIVQFLVTVELSNPDEDVRPGMTAAVNITVQQLENVLLVPNRAVRVIDGERVVYVLRNGELERISLSLGASSDTVSEVVNGSLRAGDSIVLNPPTTFGPGGPFGR